MKRLSAIILALFLPVAAQAGVLCYMPQVEEGTEVLVAGTAGTFRTCTSPAFGVGYSCSTRLRLDNWMQPTVREMPFDGMLVVQGSNVTYVYKRGPADLDWQWVDCDRDW